MTDNVTPNTSPDGAENTVVENQNTGPQNIPHDRFKKVVDERNDLRRQLAEIKAQADAQQQQALAEQGKYKELYETVAKERDTLKPLSERAQALEASIRATNEARIKQIPQAMQSVIPTDYSPDRLSEWLDKNMQILAAPRVPAMDAGAPNSGAAKPLDLSPEERQFARQFNMTDEEYAKYKTPPTTQ